MTDDEAADYGATLCRIICAVADRDQAETAAVLDAATRQDLYALVVLLADEMPAGVILGARGMPLPAYGDETWTVEQIGAAHSIYEAGQAARVVLGEQKWRQSQGWRAIA